MSVASWSPAQDLTILDLAALPPVSSLFDQHERTDRPWLRFLHRFAVAISQRVDANEDIEYLPTQLLTEYLRAWTSSSGSRIDGIRYRSAVRPGGRSYVVFAENHNCVEASGASSADAMLVFDAASVHHL